MLSFKKFIENLWGQIPSAERKPSDGYPNAQKMTMSSNSKGGGGAAPMPTKMMSKNDKKTS